MMNTGTDWRRAQWKNHTPYGSCFAKNHLNGSGDMLAFHYVSYVYTSETVMSK